MARVDVNGVGIEYEVTGHGRPVVLLHGFPDSGRLWRHQVPALAALAWGLASLAPATVDQLAVLSVGHPATFRRTPRQREKSWYMLLFQFPGIAGPR